LARRRRRQARGVVDTSVLVAGIAGFKNADRVLQNPSAILLYEWVENQTFVWLITEQIVDEYKAVLARLGVRRALIGSIINLLRQEAASIRVSKSAGISPDPSANPFCDCAEQGQADFIVTLNPRDFPQSHLTARVIGPSDPIPTTAKQTRPRERR
jgi:predicted nucleic acid-binding protein